MSRSPFGSPKGSPKTKDKGKNSPRKRQSDPDEEVLEESSGSLLAHMISQLKIGMDLTKVTLPTFLLEYRSLLEKFTDLMSHPTLLLSASEKQDPAERMLQVCKWYMSGWHVRPKGVKKPYNPILGETFRCKYDHGDSTTYYLAEQVSHHPPISAFYCENREKNMSLSGYIHTKSKFLGNSAASIMNGELNVHLLPHGPEVYSCTFPTVYARGIVVGKLTMELGDKCTIECRQSGLRVDLDFKTKGMFSGEYNAVTGTMINTANPKKPLYTFDGHWDSVMYAYEGGDKKKKNILVDVEELEVAKKIVKPEEEQTAFESRRLWKDVTDCLMNNDIDGATEHKSALEQRQRDGLAERKANNAEWEIKHFDQDGERFTYHQLNTSLYDPKKDKGKEFQPNPKNKVSPFNLKESIE
eukprot:GFYU01001423.1.p1 GENE.GFYU01001423.1~~GFYU01001423.1.p1  ORF type:complete len:412 (-),score=112.42 GFYU01001423.1:209-1444(-)